MSQAQGVDQCGQNSARQAEPEELQVTYGAGKETFPAKSFSMSLDQASIEHAASHITNSAGFSAVVLVFPHVFSTLLHFSSTPTSTEQQELV